MTIYVIYFAAMALLTLGMAMVWKTSDWLNIFLKTLFYVASSASFYLLLSQLQALPRLA